ncbi:hypothetical protein AGMMS49944_05200 [Spirochaetia bacterium]|nr:hypothetical protein AGMMS49944_05200 [Spirochaetia bacterium]
MSDWPMCSIGSLCDIVKGETGLASATPGEYPLVTTGAERKKANTWQFDTEAVCIPLVSSTGHGKKTLNYVHYQEGKFALGTILAAVIPKDKNILSASYMHRYLQFYKDRKIVPLMRGAANVSLAVRDIAKIEIPVPPIEKQRSLIQLFNKLYDFDSAFGDETATQSDIIAKLRQAVLQEAIEGKLTVDWRKSNPVYKGDVEYDAAALLDKIKIEKQRLVVEGKIRKEKPLAPIKAEDVPFALPEGWVWTRLGEVIEYTENLDIQKHLQINKIINYVDIDAIDNKTHTIREFKQKFVSELSSRARRVIKKNYIVYSTVRPYLENIAIMQNDVDNCIGSTGFVVFKPVLVRNQFVFDFLLSPSLNMKYKEMMSGFNSPGITNEQFENTYFPLPPYAEQQIIVLHIENLFAIIDELEVQMRERKGQVEGVLQVVFGEAFEK